jgi:hypothetical protein
VSLESNLRVVRPGPGLYVNVREAVVEGPDLSADILERACGALRHRHGQAAVVVRGDAPSLLVATSQPIRAVELNHAQWTLNVRDNGKDTRILRLSDPQGHVLIPRLIERALLATLAGRRRHWTLDSPRLWYEPEAFVRDRGVAAYRRFALSGLFVSGVGTCVACDVGVAFLAEETVDYYFCLGLPDAESKRRAERFAALTGRRQGQKGTLVYNAGRGVQKCYFERSPLGVTCGTTGRIRVNNETFDSLADYYRQRNPDLGDLDDAPAVTVSFPGLDRPTPVAAKLLRVRVTTDVLPGSLAQVDKLNPGERRRLLVDFWKSLDPKPLGEVAPGFVTGFWTPPQSHVYTFGLPELVFGRRTGGAPATLTGNPQRHFAQRDRQLDKAGCYQVPAAVPRKLYCAYPKQLGDDAPRQLVADLVSTARELTGVQFVSEVIDYSRVGEAIEKLRRIGRSGATLFVLNEEPASYFDVQYQLQGWRVKRVTDKTLRAQFARLQEGRSGERREQALRRWQQFVRLCTLDLLQQLDVIPWRVSDLGQYEAQVAIDVGHDRRHLALSLLIARGEHRTPSFRLATDVHVKPDPKHETINARILQDQMFALFERALSGRFDALRSLLVLRDGRAYGAEVDALLACVERLKGADYVSNDAVVDFVEFQKSSLWHLRIWEKTEREIRNAPEGTALVLSEDSVALLTTGQLTLRQGTAAPLVLTRVDRRSDPVRAGAAVFSAAQLNWSSPRVAQRLPLTLKRTDEELKARAAQEIRQMW